MKIVFHGENARNFMDDFRSLLPANLDASITGLSASLDRDGERDLGGKAGDAALALRLRLAR